MLNALYLNVEVNIASEVLQLFIIFEYFIIIILHLPDHIIENDNKNESCL